MHVFLLCRSLVGFLVALMGILWGKGWFEPYLVSPAPGPVFKHGPLLLFWPSYPRLQNRWAIDQAWATKRGTTVINKQNLPYFPGGGTSYVGYSTYDRRFWVYFSGVPAHIESIFEEPLAHFDPIFQIACSHWVYFYFIFQNVFFSPLCLAD